MGFSVSASVAILFAALLIAFGMFHGAAYNTFERVTDARSDAKDDRLVQQNTAIDIAAVNVTYNVTGEQLYHVNATVQNTGSSELSVGNTDFIIDGILRTDFDPPRAVEGNDGTDLWLPGENLTANVTLSASPDRLKVVSGPGVADTEVGLSG